MQNYIYGAGGHGKVVLDSMQAAHIDCMGFVDDKEISAWMGLKVYQLSAIDWKPRSIFIWQLAIVKQEKLLRPVLKSEIFQHESSSSNHC